MNVTIGQRWLYHNTFSHISYIGQVIQTSPLIKVKLVQNLFGEFRKVGDVYSSGGLYDIAYGRGSDEWTYLVGQDAT